MVTYAWVGAQLGSCMQTLQAVMMYQYHLVMTYQYHLVIMFQYHKYHLGGMHLYTHLQLGFMAIYKEGRHYVTVRLSRHPAYLSVEQLSSNASTDGDTVAMMVVRQLPPNESCMHST